MQRKSSFVPAAILVATLGLVLSGDLIGAKPAQAGIFDDLGIEDPFNREVLSPSTSFNVWCSPDEFTTITVNPVGETGIDVPEFDVPMECQNPEIRLLRDAQNRGRRVVQFIVNGEVYAEYLPQWSEKFEIEQDGKKKSGNLIRMKADGTLEVLQVEYLLPSLRSSGTVVH